MASTTGLPNINPIAALMLFIAIPAIVMVPLRTKLHSKRKPTWNVTNRVMKKVFDIAHVMIKMAPLVAFGNLIWLGLLTINQASYLRSKMNWKLVPQYYSTINLAEFDEMSALNYVQVQYSYNARRWSQSTGVLPDRRRLQSQVGSSLTLTYHTKDWSNMLNATVLSNICNLENDIQSINCIAGVQFTTIVDNFVNRTTCQSFPDFGTNIYQAANTDNRRFVADNTTEGNLESPVILSYFDETFCSYMNPDDLYNELNNKAAKYNLMVSYTNHDLNEQEFTNASSDSVYYLIAAGFVTFVCLVLSVRGIWVPIITMACILAAMINAAAMLPLMGFGGMSVYNGAGVLIMMVYSATSVMAFSSSWRKIVKLNTRPTPKDIVGAYQTSGHIILYVTLVSQFCFYSLISSPVLFMKQFGLFTGLSMLSFYLLFHYVVMPHWVLASKFLIPKKIYQGARDWKHDHCQCCKAIDEWCVSDGWAAAMVAANKKHEDKEFQDDEEEDEGSEDEDYEGDRPYRGRAGSNRRQSNEYEEGGTVVADVQVIHPNTPMDAFRPGDDASSNQRYNPDTGSYSSGLPLEAAPYGGEGKHDDDTSGSGDNSKDKDSEGEAEDEEEGGGGRGLRGWCKGKRPIKVIGAIMFTLTVVALIIVYILTLPYLTVDLGLPPQMSSETNLGQQYHILESFKSDLFQEKYPSNYPLVYSQAPTVAPTRLPTRQPTRRPSRFPTMQPTSTVTGYSEMPTISASIAYVDYTVYTCWGIKPKKSDRDGIPTGEVDLTSFVRYARAEENGLIADIQDWCSYVSNHREELSISPEWSTGDCLYSQFMYNTNFLRPVFQTPSIQWTEVASTTYTAGSLIGITTNSTNSNPNPAYICGNFSVRSYVSSIEAHENDIIQVKDTWESTFAREGTSKAKTFGIATMTTSPAFTYPVLNSIVLEMSLTRIIAIPLVFYAFLLWIFTIADVGLTLFGALGMFVILSIMVCLHAFFVSSTIDLFDVMLICGMLSIIVIFPVHSIGEYMNARAYVDRQMLLVETANDNGQEDKVITPAISMTNKHIRHAIVMPTMLFVFTGIPMLMAELNIYRKVGQYMIIVGVLSFVFTYFIQPYLLAFGCRTRIYETLCVEVEEEEEEEEEVDGDEGSEGSESDGGEDGQSEYTRSNYTTPSQMMMPHPGNVSMYQTIPPPPPQGYIMPNAMPNAMVDNDARSEYSRGSIGSQPSQQGQMMMSMYAPNNTSMMMVPRGPRPMYQGTLGGMDPVQVQPSNTPGAPGYPSMHNMYERHPSGFSQLPPGQMPPAQPHTMHQVPSFQIPMVPNPAGMSPQQQSMYRPGSVYQAPPANMSMYGQPMQGAPSQYNMNPNAQSMYYNSPPQNMSMYGMPPGQPQPRPY